MQQRYNKKQQQTSNQNNHKSLDDANEFIVENADESKQRKFPHHKPKRLWLIRIVVGVLLFISIIAVIVISLHQRSLNRINDDHGSSSSSSSSSSLQQQQQADSQQDTAFLQFPMIRPLPEWMMEYMTWHTQQLLTLDETNWKNKHKYLIARCLDIDRVCGGVSDRLKSLPTFLLLARLSNRILFIHWNRPTRLEEFLIPTPFINWTLPSYIPVKGSGTRLYTKLSTLIKATIIHNSTVPILCARVQDQHGGSEFYNDHHHLAQQQQPSSQHMTTTNRVFRTVFRSVFFSFFQPSNRVSQSLTRIQNELFQQHTTIDVEPGMYHAVHFRAHYSKSMTKDQIAPWAINAVYCAHQNFNNNITTTPKSHDGIDHPKIHHDLPILFLSDSNVAVQAVRNHFSTLSSSIIQVLTVPRDMEPMHLDQPSSSQADDAAFVDLLLMAHARCVAHGQGGYGRFGALLSLNPMCFFKYFENAKWKICQSASSSSSIFP